MSKLTKLIKNPKLFFSDIKKKSAPKKSAPKTLAPLLYDNVNLLTPFTHLLHTGESDNGINHLNIWIPFFLESNVKFLIVTRHIITYKNVQKEYPLIDVVYAKSDKDIKYIFRTLSFLKASFYPSNTGNNLHILQFNHIKHIFIGHGDSDKTASAHKFFRVYDENWVASDAHKDRFYNEGFNFSGLKFIKVGRTNLVDILVTSNKKWNERFMDNINLLYLSTWEGFVEEQDYTSVYIIKDIFKKLSNIKNLNINVKLHPGLGRRDTKVTNMSNELELFTEENKINCTIHTKQKLVSDLIVKSNIFICDISAVVSECLAANAPIFVYIPSNKKIKLSQSKMPFSEYTYTFSDSNELMEKLNIVLNGDDYLASNRNKAMQYILGTEETLNRTFINELIKIEKVENCE